jgi:hypothetical protein
VVSKKRKILFVILAVVLMVSLATTIFFLSLPIVTIHSSGEVPAGSVSPQQALKTAMPYITQYANDHNRIITNVDVRFLSSYEDWDHVRSNQTQSYPVWVVDARFLQGFDFYSLSDSSDGYSVTVWADTGEYVIPPERTATPAAM